MDCLSVIFQQLRHLTAHIPQASSTPIAVSASDMLAFDQARSSIEYSLACLSPTITSPSTDTDENETTNESLGMGYAFEAHRLAALVYASIVLRRCSANGGFQSSIKAQLITTIQAAESISPCRLTDQKTVTWVYFVGGLTALSSSEEMFFAKRIARAMRKNEMHSWDEVETGLKQVLWVDALSEMVWMSLWPSVQSTLDERPDETLIKMPNSSYLGWGDLHGR